MYFKLEKGRLYLLCPHGSVMRHVTLGSTVEDGVRRLKLKRHRRGYNKGKLYLKDLAVKAMGDSVQIALHDEGYFEVTADGYRGTFSNWPIPAATWD